MIETDRARHLVAEAVLKLIKQFPDVSPGGLGPEAPGLARALERTVRARWLTLQGVIESRLTRNWENTQPQIQAALLTATAELLLLRDCADHAAVDEAVRWIKGKGVPRGAAGLVNAVLRRIIDLRGDQIDNPDPLRQDHLCITPSSGWALTEEALSDIPIHLLSQQTGHGVPLLRRWNAEAGWEETLKTAMHGIIEPPILVTAIDGDSIPELTPHDRPGWWVFSGPHTRLLALLEEHPAAQVQDPTAAAAVEATASSAPKLIIDVCAGLGTKTAQVRRVHPEAMVVATDVLSRRVEALRERFKDDDHVTVCTLGELMKWRGQVDLLMLDVPCSNTGVLARRPEARYRTTDEVLLELVDLQRQIAADAMVLPGPGGEILWSTCSLEDQENGAQAKWLAKWHHFRIVQEQSIRPSGGEGKAYWDGGYHAILAAPNHRA